MTINMDEFNKTSNFRSGSQFTVNLIGAPSQMQFYINRFKMFDFKRVSISSFMDENNDYVDVLNYFDRLEVLLHGSKPVKLIFRELTFQDWFIEPELSWENRRTIPMFHVTYSYKSKLIEKISEVENV